MKKVSIVLALVLGIMAVFNSITFAAKLPLRVVVNGDLLYFPDAQPFVDQNNRTQIPVRFIGEALGAEVTWDSKAQKAMFIKGDANLSLFIGKKEYDLNGEKLLMDTAALLKDKRTYVPARYVAEAFGAKVRWDSTIQTVYITTEGHVDVPEDPKQGITTYYDGIAYNNVKDVDIYGRMTMGKSKEFMFKLADQIKLVRENGKFIMKGTYPELPDGYKWDISISISKKMDKSDRFISENQLPTHGGFSIEYKGIKSTNEVEFYAIRMGIVSMNTNTSEVSPWIGELFIIYGEDYESKAYFLPASKSANFEMYPDFDYSKVFQW